MHIARTIEEVRTHVGEARRDGKRIGFVPTMGYLHRGHLSLVEESKTRTDYQVMSIFVNRIQFNDPKDFDTYPIDLDRDCAMARDAGVDLMFVPDENEMYRRRLAYVDVDILTDHLCGASRPGHFRGVYTVVAKLFNIVQPDVSVFGQKDIQQAVSIDKMTRDLDFPVSIIIAPTIREADGLAMSSRNARLSPDERARATALSRGLKKAETMILAGERGSAALAGAVRGTVEESSPDAIDYLSVVRYEDLGPVDVMQDKSVIAAAVFYGGTRLIDNMIVDFGKDGPVCIW